MPMGLHYVFDVCNNDYMSNHTNHGSTTMTTTEIRDIALSYTKDVVSHYRAKEQGRWEQANDYAVTARMQSHTLHTILGTEFAAALTTYCREEAMHLVNFPTYAETCGHWVAGGDCGLDPAKGLRA